MFTKREKEFLAAQNLGRLATVSPEGQPHVVPLCFAFDGENLYFHTGEGSKKVRNMERNGKVAFVVDRWVKLGEFGGLMVLGDSEILRGGEEFRLGRSLIYKKYPGWEQMYPIVEGSDIFLKVKPKSVISWRV